MRLADKKKCALVLSGGGIKAAAFHIGVCLALKEKGFQFAGGSKGEVDKWEGAPLTFRTYVGSSAGSVICTFLASGYSLTEIIDAFMLGAGIRNFLSVFKKKKARLKPITYADIFALNRSTLRTLTPLQFLKKPLVEGGLEALLKNGFKINGLFSTSNMERYIREHVVHDNSFHDLGVELYIIGTQLNHSRKAVFGPFPEAKKERHIKYVPYATISQSVAASAALPPVFAPYGIPNEKGKVIFYFDGEIRDTLSTHVAADQDADLVISSYSIQPYHFTREMGSLHEHGIPLIFNQALYQVVEQKIAKHIEHQQQIKAVMQAVDGYFKQKNLPETDREKLLEILKQRTHYKDGVDYIYVHPSAQDYEMFFVDHFSLNPTILARIVKIGFKSGMKVLRSYNIK